MTKKHCPKCNGSGKVTYTATEYRGGKIVRSFTYEAACPWCHAAFLFQAEKQQ